MSEEKTRENHFGNIDELSKNTSQLADWQFKETVVEKINELILRVNEIEIALSIAEKDEEVIENAPLATESK